MKWLPGWEHVKLHKRREAIAKYNDPKLMCDAVMDAIIKAGTPHKLSMVLDVEVTSISNWKLGYAKVGFPKFIQLIDYLGGFANE